MKNNKYMKSYSKNKEWSYLQYWDVNNLYGWAMSQNLLANNFEWVEDASQFNEAFIKNSNEETDEALKLKLNVLKNYMNLIKIHYFYTKE